MTIRATVFDIGGVLEFTPDTSWQQKWEHRLDLKLGEVFQRLDSMGSARWTHSVKLSPVGAYMRGFLVSKIAERRSQKH